MSDTITQMRLSMRLERYLSDYTNKNIRKDTPSTVEWKRAWQVAEVARTEKALTPELVDDVRLALKMLESAGEMPGYLSSHNTIISNPFLSTSL